MKTKERGNSFGSKGTKDSWQLNARCAPEMTLLRNPMKLEWDLIYKCQVSDFYDFIVVIVGKYSGGRKYTLKYPQLMGHEISNLTLQ